MIAEGHGGVWFQLYLAQPIWCMMWQSHAHNAQMMDRQCKILSQLTSGWLYLDIQAYQPSLVLTHMK